MKTLLYSFILSTLLFFNKSDANTDLIREAVDNPHRKEENKERDVYRNPYETLNFFELDRSKKVLEITKKNRLINQTILFSPSAASFDTFKNFEDRGYYFNKLVKKHLYGK